MTPALLVWIMVPFVVLAVLALRNVKPWNVRYVAVAAPWLLALVAAGLAALPRRPGTVLTGLLCALTLVSLGNLQLNGRYARADLRGAVAWLADHDAGGTPVVVPGVTGVWEFYAGDRWPVIAAWGVAPLGSPRDADAYVAATPGRDGGCLARAGARLGRSIPTACWSRHWPARAG